MSTDTKNLNHSTWECQYHVVFTPTYRKKVLYGMIRLDLKGRVAPVSEAEGVCH